MANKKPQTKASVAGEAGSPPISTSSRAKPLVFISHDTRDADIAEAFANLLQDASGGVLRSFRSSDRKGTSGIEFGAEWYTAIMDRLKDASDVVALLTEQSLGRPWLLYEAGVAKGRLDTVVFGIAVGVPLSRAGIGPFAQFQNSADDEDSLTKLVLQLIRRNPDAEPREEAVRRQVVAFRTSAAQILKKRPKDAATTDATPDLNASAVAKLFEEVKVMFRQLPDQLERSIERRLVLEQRGLRPMESDFVRRIYRRLVEAAPGNGAEHWNELSRAVRPIDPSLATPLRKMRDAWRSSDERLIQEAGGQLIERARQGNFRERIRNMPPELVGDLDDLWMMVDALMKDRQTTLLPDSAPDLTTAHLPGGKPSSKS